jgi:hypothetical protein
MASDSDSAAMPYLRQMTPANGWHPQLVRDRRGEPVAIVTVRVGPTWTDAVAIEAEDRCVAMRSRTHDDSPLVVPESATGTVWFRDGTCAEVIAELFELQRERPQ